MTDAGLNELAGCTKLTSLRLGGPKVTDAGVRALAGMTDSSTSTCRTEITDAGIAEVARHRRLTGSTCGGRRR